MAPTLRGYGRAQAPGQRPDPKVAQATHKQELREVPDRAPGNTHLQKQWESEARTWYPERAANTGPAEAQVHRSEQQASQSRLNCSQMIKGLYSQGRIFRNSCCSPGNPTWGSPRRVAGHDEQHKPSIPRTRLVRRVQWSTFPLRLGHSKAIRRDLRRAGPGPSDTRPRAAP